MEMLSVRQAAELAKVSVPTIRSWYRSGVLRNMEHDVTGHCLIPKEEIDHILVMRKAEANVRKMSLLEEDGDKLSKALDKFLKVVKSNKE